MSITLRGPAAAMHIGDQALGQRAVEPSGGLVQQQDRSAGEEGPGHGQPAAFPSRDRHAVFSDLCLEARGEGIEPGDQLCGLQGGGDLLLGRIGAPQHHIGAYGAGEELGPLVHQGAGGPYLFLAQPVDGDPSHREHTTFEGPKAQEGADEAGLARPA